MTVNTTIVAAPDRAIARSCAVSGIGAIAYTGAITGKGAISANVLNLAELIGAVELEAGDGTEFSGS